MTAEIVVRPPDHQRISPTAKLVAYYRTFSDIPYASEISEAIGGKEAALAILGEDDLPLNVKISAPFIEARYKCFNRFVDAFQNVIELAVGTSVERGISVANDPNRFYIGTDLPGMIAETRWLMNRVANANASRNNHCLEPANVISCDEMAAAASNLGARKSVVVINEGLMDYLSMEEQAACAENVRRILQMYGGQWVTTDIWDEECNERFAAAADSEIRSLLERTSKRLSSLTGRVSKQSCFPDVSSAMRFFHNCGFKMEKHSVVDDVTAIRSIDSLWSEHDKSLYVPLLKDRVVWAMSLR